VIPTIIGQVLAGGVVRIGSVSPVRDFTFVEDTARAFLAVAAAADVDGQVLNAGSGKAITIGALAQTILELMDSDAEIVTDEERIRPNNSEVFELIADASKLHQMTGWSPQVSLRQGLERVATWAAAYPQLLKPHIYNV
jgi:nucleoside-diphosphate-sugar epimerase